MRIACLTVALLLVAFEARAQLPTDKPSPAPESPVGTSGSSGVFKSGIELVALNVVVTDSRQKFVNGLRRGDFDVFEDGVPQQVSYFSAGDTPLDLAILLDTSASMTEQMRVVHQAAQGLLGTLRPDDRVMVVDVKGTSRILYQLGSDLESAGAAIRSTAPSGRTGLFNSLYLTFNEFEKGRRHQTERVRRQAIVVLSDGLDTSSLLTFDDVMDVAKKSGVAVYTITLRSQESSAGGGKGDPAFDPSYFPMKALAQETGARAFFPNDGRGLKNAYEVIATELANQYAIAYTPTNQKSDGAFRRILVRVTTHPDARARTRPGYTPPNSTRSGRLE
jgi:Ca-activated chloride channel family protein